MASETSPNDNRFKVHDTKWASDKNTAYMTTSFSPKSYPSLGNVIQEKTLEGEYLQHIAVHCNPLISSLKIDSPSEIQREIFKLSLCERVFRNPIRTAVAAPGLQRWGLSRIETIVKP